jgi:DNA modification methylase
LRNIVGGARIGRFRPDGKCAVENRAFGEGKQIRTNVWQYNVGFCNAEHDVPHPAKFPLELATDHILSWSSENDLVLDPFMGSGTVAIAASKTNRRYLGIEISPEYVDLAQKRIDDYLRQGQLFDQNDL